MELVYTLGAGLSGLWSDPVIALYIMAGVFVGMVFGAIPGLSAALAVTLGLPFTFAMTAEQGLCTLMGLYVGGISGGLISATLLNIPGTPASLVTCFDAAPMARSGRPGDALALGVFSSVVGGLFSALVLIVIAPPLSKVTLWFGPWEYFAMGIMGLSVVISLCSRDIIKGCMAAVFGILLSSVGLDEVSGASRFTFGYWQLSAGLNNLATLMGLFAFAEVMTQLRNLGVKSTQIPVEKISLFPKYELICGHNKDFLVASIIGTFIGILPGVGSGSASLIAYNQIRQISKEPEKFGTGIASGIIASESANNAVTGGAIIPMLTLGIPGDVVTAILLGGLILHGLQPGPQLFTNNNTLIGVIFVGFIAANIIMYFMQMTLMQGFIKLMSVPFNYLFPSILIMCLVGTFSVNNRIFDSWVFLIIGILGYIFVNLDFSLPPLILGYILGPIVERNFRTAIISSRGNLGALFTRPIAVSLIVFGIFIAAWPYITRKKQKNSGNL